MKTNGRNHETVVGFDLDGVLATNDRMYEALARESGVHLDSRHWVEYDFFRYFGVTKERFIELLIDDRVLEEAIPATGLWEAMNAVRDAGLGIAIVTARGFHPRGEQVTRDWLEQWHVPFDQLTLVHLGETKVHALSAIPNVLTYVDDHLDHLHDLRRSEHAARLFVMDQPWNRKDTTFIRTHQLMDYVDHAQALHRAAERKAKP